MYHRVRRKMRCHFTLITLLILDYINNTQCKSIDTTQQYGDNDDNFDNNIIDFDSVYNDKLNKKYDPPAWHENNKLSHRYTVINNNRDRNEQKPNKDGNVESKKEMDSILTTESSFIPSELISTTEDEVISLVDSTEAPDLTVIPLSSTQKTTPGIEISTIMVPTSTPNIDTSTNESYFFETTENPVVSSSLNNTSGEPPITEELTVIKSETSINLTLNVAFLNSTTGEPHFKLQNETSFPSVQTITNNTVTTATNNHSENITIEDKESNSTKTNDTNSRLDESGEVDVPIFTELDIDDTEVPEDYYDAKDVVPTKPPNVDALSLIFGLAGSVVESVAERVVPKGIFELYKRMQKQNEALEAERLRSREENGGLGQFGRGILKSISTGLSAPFSQLMAGARDNGSLDSDRGFVSGVASGVTNVANSVVDAFKTRVQAIYPGTLWCGDGHSAQARSSDLGLFFFTDTCCRQHDACKLYIRSGQTKHGLTNTGLFTRSHCSCDAKFRSCLQKTGSLISGQIGLTYFNVLGPQCFRKAHPIVRCVRRTRITGQKCEEYELDYTKPKMWQWFDNETF